MVSDIHNMLKGQEGISSRPQLVSETRTLSLIKYTLTVT